MARLAGLGRQARVWVKLGATVTSPLARAGAEGRVQAPVAAAFPRRSRRERPYSGPGEVPAHCTSGSEALGGQCRPVLRTDRGRERCSCRQWWEDKTENGEPANGGHQDCPGAVWTPWLLGTERGSGETQRTYCRRRWLGAWSPSGRPRGQPRTLTTLRRLAAAAASRRRSSPTLARQPTRDGGSDCACPCRCQRR